VKPFLSIEEPARQPNP